MLPPWFNAPVGSRMVSRHFQTVTSGGEFQFHLHLDAKDGRQVPTGYQTVLTHAYVGITWDNPSPDLQNMLWDDQNLVGWSIWAPEMGALTPLLPFAMNSATNDTAASTAGSSQNGVVAIPCPPLVSPIVISEGNRAFVRGLASAAGDRALVWGWVVGFTMPVVNDVPGTRRYFTEGRHP